jgi:hypothetical protein
MMTWDVKTKGHNILIPAGQPKSRGVPASLHISPSKTVFTRTPWQPPTSAPHEDMIVLPSNGISRYARNRPPLSCYHARQAVAQKA